MRVDEPPDRMQDLPTVAFPISNFLLVVTLEQSLLVILGIRYK